jgi:glycerophosphoryl diester phosphodiesterase
MKIIAHRAINYIDPENSLAAFEWAMKKGYSIELDIHMTKDGVPVVSHDLDIGRVFNGTGKITDMTLMQLKSYSYKSHPNVKMPTFEEVCKLYQRVKPKGFFICIQIKDMYQKDVMRKTYDIVKKYNLPKECFFFEVDKNAWPLVDWMKKNIKYMPVGLHLPENSPDYTKEKFDKADVIWADEISFGWISREMVELAHSLGKRIYAISAELIQHSKNAPHYRRRWNDLVKYGFDGICTDHPEELELFLEENNAEIG